MTARLFLFEDTRLLKRTAEGVRRAAKASVLLAEE
jgi:hypothetical protein